MTNTEALVYNLPMTEETLENTKSNEKPKNETVDSVVGDASLGATGVEPPVAAPEETESEGEEPESDETEKQPKEPEKPPEWAGSPEKIKGIIGAYATEWAKYMENQVIGDGTIEPPTLKDAKTFEDIEEYYKVAGGTDWEEFYRAQVGLYDPKNQDKIKGGLEAAVAKITAKEGEAPQNYNRLTEVAEERAKQTVKDLIEAAKTGGYANIELGDGSFVQARLKFGKKEDEEFKKLTKFNELKGNESDNTLVKQLNRGGSTLFRFSDIASHIQHCNMVSHSREDGTDLHSMQDALGDSDMKINNRLAGSHLIGKGIEPPGSDSNTEQWYFSSSKLDDKSEIKKKDAGFGLNWDGYDTGGTWISTPGLFSYTLRSSVWEEHIKSADDTDGDTLYLSISSGAVPPVDEEPTSDNDEETDGDEELGKEDGEVIEYEISKEGLLKMLEDAMIPEVRLSSSGSINFEYPYYGFDLEKIEKTNIGKKIFELFEQKPSSGEFIAMILGDDDDYKGYMKSKLNIDYPERQELDAIATKLTKDKDNINRIKFVDYKKGEEVIFSADEVREKYLESFGTGDNVEQRDSGDADAFMADARESGGDY